MESDLISILNRSSNMSRLLAVDEFRDMVYTATNLFD